MFVYYMERSYMFRHRGALRSLVKLHRIIILQNVMVEIKS